MKERETELEKNKEDKQQLKNQIHDLTSGLQNLQTTTAVQVRRTQAHAKSRETFVFMCKW